jgi:hypothetical protein
MPALLWRASFAIRTRRCSPPLSLGMGLSFLLGGLAMGDCPLLARRWPNRLD